MRLLVVFLLMLPLTSFATEGFIPPGNINYVGSFLPPSGARNGTDYGYATRTGLGWDSVRNLVLLGGAANDCPSMVEALKMPALVTDHSYNKSNLNEATVVVPFADPTNGKQTCGLTGTLRADILHMTAKGNQATDNYYWVNYIYYAVDGDSTGKIGWIDPDLSPASSHGEWALGTVGAGQWGQSLLEIDNAWADKHIGGKYLGAGRTRASDSLGPSLYASAPWLESSGTPPADQTKLDYKELMYYPLEHPMESWSRGVDVDSYDSTWIEIDGKQSFVVLWTATWPSDQGTRFWSSQIPMSSVAYKNRCQNFDPTVSTPTAEINSTQTTIPVSNGSVYPPNGGLIKISNEYILYEGVSGNNLLGCTRGYYGAAVSHNSGTATYLINQPIWDYGNQHASDGYYATPAMPILMFFDVDQLAEVAAGARKAWDLQPYAYYNLDDIFFETQSRDNEVPWSNKYSSGLAYDKVNKRLIVSEVVRDGSAEPIPVLHVLDLTNTAKILDTQPPTTPLSVLVSQTGELTWTASTDNDNHEVTYVIYKWYNNVCAVGNNEFRPIWSSFSNSWTDPLYEIGDKYQIVAVDKSMNTSGHIISIDGPPLTCTDDPSFCTNAEQCSSIYPTYNWCDGACQVAKCVQPIKLGPLSF